MAEYTKELMRNRRAWHDYYIEETFEAGIELSGTEVKSIRLGRMNLKESYISVDSGEAKIHGMHISPYEQGNVFNRDPLRVRRLLLHKREINRLRAQVMQQGYSIVPLRVYLKRGLVKLEIALAKGKKQYDKRHELAKKDAQREIERSLSKGARDE
ncbi:MAG: SsrA-binding protein SmpB [Christensenellales bacterium]|jgi:SsrA-binding protein